MNSPYQNLRRFQDLCMKCQRFPENEEFRKLLGEMNHYMPKLVLADNELFSVAALVFNHKGQVLSVSRRNQPANIGLPGGKIDPGENPQLAMCRELREETGIQAITYLPVYERQEDTANGRPSRTYYVSSWVGEPQMVEPGLSVEWVEPRDLLAEQCSFKVYNENLFNALTF